MDKIEKRKKKLQNTIKESKKIGANALELIANDIENEIEDLALKNKTSAENRRNAYDKKKKKDQFAQYIDTTFGDFHFSKYEELLKLNLSTQLMHRFEILCSHSDYDYKLRFGNAIKTSKRNEFDNSRKDNVESYMVEKDLSEVLGLKKLETLKTKKALIENKLITINENKTITVNKKYICIGGITKKMKENGGFSRMFNKTIQELHGNALPKDHKQLGLLYKLLPYINKYHNMVTSLDYVDEIDITKVKGFKMKELAFILGYTEKNMSRLKKDLFALKVNGEVVIGIFETCYGKRMYINPRVYYKGNNIEDLKALTNMFSAK